MGLRKDRIPYYGTLSVATREGMMKRFVFAAAVLALGFAVSTAARADFAVIKMKDGSCRTWSDTKMGPMGMKGKDWWWVGKPVMTREAAAKRGAWAMKHKMCKSWS
jgi:hypothetical protein